MSELKFEGEMMRRLERLYHAADLVTRRRTTLAMLGLRPGERVLDIGSGPGFLAEEMAEVVGQTGEIRGIDISAPLVDMASDRNTRHWLSYTVADASAHWERPEAYDVVVSIQVAEYVANLDGFCAGFRRVMKPGGRGLIVATDWGGLVWKSDNPSRMDRISKAWETHCTDPHLPRNLLPALNQAGLRVDAVSAYQQVNLDWTDDGYSKHLAGFMRAHAEASSELPADLIAAWYDELPALAREGRYFFALASFNFEVSRQA